MEAEPSTLSLSFLPTDDGLPRDPASVRFRSVAEIMLRGIRRCVAADNELSDETSVISAQDKPVRANLGDSLPEPLDFVSDKALSVSRVSKTLFFCDAQDIQNKGNSSAKKQDTETSQHC
jgi:hypothetical protein